jgi:hypothetical protein
MTDRVERTGDLVWIAEPTFDDEPTREQVCGIDRWRWPIFFPLSAAIQRKIVTPIGIVPIPKRLRPFPVMRGGNKKMGWMAFTQANGVRQLLGPTTDSSLPIAKVVNDTALKEMIVSGWKPETEW